MRQLFFFPAAFFGGWLFNFVYDVQFLSGFLTGWLMHSWIGDILT